MEKTKKQGAVVDRGYVIQRLVGLGIPAALARAVAPSVGAEMDKALDELLPDERLRKCARTALRNLI
jgi:hypothetical protein